MSEFKDLSGDPVFDYFKKNVAKGFEIEGGLIETPKMAGPKEPKKIIKLKIKNLEGQVGTMVYNYNKIERELNRG